jgi:hypothetical protein
MMWPDGMLCVRRSARYAACTLAAVILGALYTVLTRENDRARRAARIQMIVLTAIAILRFRGRRTTSPAGSALHGSSPRFLE